MPRNDASKAPNISKPIYRRDALFKATATLPEVYQGILLKYLPKRLLTKLALKKARLINPTTVDKHLRERLADVAVEIPFASGKGTCCVGIEQQAQGPFPPQRGLEYQIRFIRAIRKEKGDNHPVAVCTIVLHSSCLPATQTTDIFAGLSVEEQQIARECLGTVYAVELGKIPDEQLNDATARGVLEILLKHSRGTCILPTLNKLWRHLQRIKKTPQGQEFVDTVLNYAFLAARETERCDIIKEIGKHFDEQEEASTMTVASALKREGRQEGRQQGLEEAATRMLRRGMQAKEIIEITHLSKQRIIELLEKIKQKITKSR